MSASLIYLVDEMCTGVEIYFTGRQGGQYLKAGFLLCDDYVELCSKLYLTENVQGWSDKRPKSSFKTFTEVLNEVGTHIAQNNPANTQVVNEIQERMKERRKRRNDFFHTTSLLDLNVSARNCVESFCDLFDYGESIFPNDWVNTIRGTRNLETLETLLRLEKKAFSDPNITTQVNDILLRWPKNKKTIRARGEHIATHPEDLHLRLCIVCGGQALRDKLRVLL